MLSSKLYSVIFFYLSPPVAAMAVPACDDIFLLYNYATYRESYNPFSEKILVGPRFLNPTITSSSTNTVQSADGNITMVPNGLGVIFPTTDLSREKPLLYS